MTLHYIFSNSEYDSCDHEMNDEFSEYSLGESNETQGILQFWANTAKSVIIFISKVRVNT